MCIKQRIVIALEGGCNSKPCNGQGQGKVAKPAKTDMAAKGNVDKIKTKATHATVHVINKVKTTSGHACAQG